MKKLAFLIAALALILPTIQAQKDVHLTVKHLLGSQPFGFNQAATNDLGNNFSITRVDYYMSKFTLIHDGGIETPVNADTYILARGSSNVSVNLGNYNVTNIEGIKFHIGVDMPNNLSDPTQYNSHHPLEPTSPSMHWGWASGYRFVALEGLAGANLTTGFEMHGLLNPNYFEQTITTNGVVDGNALFINLDADYTQALKGINVTSGPIDHGTNATDLTVLQNFRDYVFSPGSGFPNSISTLENALDVSVFPNPSTGLVSMIIKDSKPTSLNASVFDVTGRLVDTFILLSNTKYELNLHRAGVYFLQIKDSQEGLSTRKIVIR